ncbi:M15 family metallopeptidase [Saccharothrix variisporea]|uniref:D-alanyl-D-alanine carboxypeptidase-like protein n=1 Tax=Saccharothrix variisporea TaxID=543527 RepID=A0A495XLZ8_9PSEU|nr:M15 family metallopeptidase [Saccharothrix variisporea]RKT74922.1 D-alanyl-D-alanine carboxypeptidase-like protein [Saccharothrix variisporea]
MKSATRVLALVTLIVSAALVGTTPAPAAPARTVELAAPAGSGLPPYVAVIKPVTAKRLGSSWREGCPVGPDQLRLVSLNFVGFDGAVHRGELVVNAALAVEVARVFADLYFARFPIQRMETIEKYDSDDDASMAANNTSAFNCRPITGGTAWSNHSYGRAIDVNTVQNPYISRSGTVYPPNGAPYVDRTQDLPGMIHAGDATEQAFTTRGWTWGGFWTTPIDYQHFEKP